MRTTFLKLQKQLRKNFPKSDLDVVRKAYAFASGAHQNQIRLTGDPHVLHTLEVALILAKLGMDPVTCSAALLHDVLEDTAVTRAQLAAEFGEEIASMVDGVTKVGSFSFAEELTREEKQAQNIRKMLVATAKDVRVILIKLADRLHNMRTIEPLDKKRRERISRETLDIYAPLAHRLGISQWKWELEDHAFRQLMPEEYKATAAQVAMRRKEREEHLEQVIAQIEAELDREGIVARVTGRPKHLYSIYTKMVQQGKDFSEVMDILGVRIVTQTMTDCYAALGAVHKLWKPVPGRVKDYIAMPKLNMYQAIHTTVVRENGLHLEVQIRTEEMDRTAREGIAAHWVYKEGTRDKKLDDRLASFRQMFEWIKDAQVAAELMDNMRKDFGTTNVYVFTPKGAVKELPDGATPLDFAYLIHSDVGHHCVGAKVNQRMVPLHYHLQTGDVVEILTSRNQQPHLDWLDIVVTGRARTRIRQRLRELGELHPLDDPGRKPPREHAVAPRIAPVRQVDEKTRLALVRVGEKKGIEVHFGRCCNPMPGEPVLAYATKRTGITVHRADCKNFQKQTPDVSRVLEAGWDGDESFSFSMRVEIRPRPNALADITQTLRPMNIEITHADYGPGPNGQSVFEFTAALPDRETLQRMVRALRLLTGVSRVDVVKRGDAMRQAG